MQNEGERPPPLFTDTDYLLDAELAVHTAYDAGDGVTVVEVTPPKGQGPTRFVILINGVAQRPPYDNLNAAKRAADRLARKPGNPPGDGSDHSSGATPSRR